VNGEPPFYFIVAFWGPEYRQHFLRLCASSLLSPGNIPSLSERRASRFLICTTREDWAHIQADPIIRLLAASTVLEFIEIRRPVPDFLKPVYREKLRRSGAGRESVVASQAEAAVSPEEVASPESFAELQSLGREIGRELTVHHHYALRVLFMSAGHKVAACRAHADKAYAIFLAPDMVLSDGAIAELDKLAREGRKVVLAAACRFGQEQCLQAFQVGGFMVPGKPLVVSPRQLVEIAFANMHPETACFEFDSPYFCQTATSALWRVPGDDGVLIHSFFWAPLLVSYGDVRNHRAEYFDNGGTTDGKYIAMHFDSQRDITIIADSDRLMLASFTPNEEYYYPVTSRAIQRSAVGTDYKIYRLRLTLHGHRGDDLKRRLYAVPVRLHSRPLSPAWEAVELRASSIVARAVEPPGRLVLWAIRLNGFLHGQRFGSLCWFVITYPVSKLPSRRRDQLRRLIRKVGIAA
jgi:hypothetical protein